MKLVLTEPRIPQCNEELVEMGELSSKVQEIDPWTEQVPLLSNGIRTGNSERAWAGRTIDISRVVRRWCRFATLEDIDII